MPGSGSPVRSICLSHPGMYPADPVSAIHVLDYIEMPASNLDIGWSLVGEALQLFLNRREDSGALTRLARNLDPRPDDTIISTTLRADEIRQAAPLTRAAPQSDR